MSIVLSEIFNDVRSISGCEEIMFPVNPKKVTFLDCYVISTILIEVMRLFKMVKISPMI